LEAILNSCFHLSHEHHRIFIYDHGTEAKVMRSHLVARPFSMALGIFSSQDGVLGFEDVASGKSY
jgi:hypothetical protein